VADAVQAFGQHVDEETQAPRLTAHYRARIPFER
jgi:hypothetical protein